MTVKPPTEWMLLPYPPPITAPSPPVQVAGSKPNTVVERVISVETNESSEAPVELELRQSETARVDPARPEVTKPDPGRPETARHASAQIVEAIRQGRDGSIDVALNPEELGRVRLTLSGSDGALHVTIQSERPETGDLLRRHIAQLERDFQDLGYVNVSIDFGKSPDQSWEGRTNATLDDQPPDEATPQRAAQSSVQFQGPAPKIYAGLDMRL